MRNKLKQSKKCRNASFPNKDLPRKDEVVLVLSESSCSNDETTAEDVAAASICTRKVKPLPEQRKTFCTKELKIAPIFLLKTQHSNGKRSSDVKRNEYEDKGQKSVLPLQCEDVKLVESQQQQLPTISHLTQRNGSCRGQLSVTTLHSCLEEIQSSNPAFPVRALFSTLQKKAGLSLCSKAENSPGLTSPQSHVKEKRKRGNESSERVPKRLRSSLTAEGAAGMGHFHIPAKDVLEREVMTVKKQPRRNKLSRTHRLRSGRPAGLENNCEPSSGLISHAESDSQSLKICDISQRDYSYEDVLWTDKYSPQHSSAVIGNAASVNKLQSWLKKWKLRADCEERRKMEERKKEENSSDSWDCGDFRGEAGEEDEPLGNTMLITGPPGVGKTASVYACSQELGFKVFEVNCSSLRSGHHVLSQLKEATQSHLVEMPGKDPLKPTYFNNYSCTAKSETLPGKTVPVKNVTSKKRAAQSIGRSTRKGKANPATVTLSNYFKMKAKADLLHSGGLSPSKKPDGNTYDNPSTDSDQTASQNKKTATSLILFEEVDVIFDDDVGFLAAIKTFMTTTKRPVILTTNDSSFKERFNCSVEKIFFKAPSEANACAYLQLVALAENVRLQLDDVRSLLKQTRGDVRRCLLQLQMWLQSGGGRLPKEPTHVQHSDVNERGHNAEPPCDTGCTASMLGLHPVTPEELQNLLKAGIYNSHGCQLWTEVEMIQLLRLLAESWRRAVPLLYANLELLLPVGAEGTSVHFPDKGTCSGLQNELAPSDNHPHIQQQDENGSQKEPVTNGKSFRTVSRLSRRKYIAPMIDTTASHTSKRTSSSSQRAHSRAQSSRDTTEQNTAKLVTDSLDALTDFFDLMSYLDATMPAATPLVSGSCKPEAFVWTGAGIKDGLLDEVREEEEEGSMNWSQERLLDIQAAVEGLGCHRCCWWVSVAWTEAQKHRQEQGDTRWERLVERLTPPVSSKRESLSFSCYPLCAASVSQRRFELSRKVLGSKSFSLLGNRRAVSVDYMPVLRYICRCQREEPLRCPSYLSCIGLGLSKSTIQLLAEDFS
uniref:ATPase family AAA domain-containing protein 5b n=1 Tax=Semicossyphus pulcher TaxID=241346 RepID=UPI0037E72ED4